jgi:hypothetical protein
MRNFRLPPRCKWDLRSSGMLRSVELVVSYRSFGTNYRFHLQGSRSHLKYMPQIYYLYIIYIYYIYWYIIYIIYNCIYFDIQEIYTTCFVWVWNPSFQITWQPQTRDVEHVQVTDGLWFIFFPEHSIFSAQAACIRRTTSGSSRAQGNDKRNWHLDLRETQ